ncbi:GTP-binding protein Di-Ras3 [Otolemur garnettii]|uniref:DIRAS family GTPase 3 n=1 Tax=Otolemur garnettii TaxID=30611 RepID=H0WNC2_OTOGA|nr:GTP-binding protein Di-Ras3 [Otolemur garnettii]XP_023365708.1 GTP-binding protein Di-Ras3 [Otolemur garnettii]XP_023365709.1 GTP-binding protein Di-Ras3 [Otolemur garnettii]XP_023365710.1 GTP-binding protein Di-Ras3 [Otolemur garnettii]XP_023365711.1 GTP-binding protein Di-Ras3 [Otolemur garnettii]XP_023365712.1 GTP-binding protein Di-Ras3 [Otolemur garnettii]
MSSSGFGPQDWLLRKLQLLRSVLVAHKSQPGQRPVEYLVIVAGSAGVGKSSLMQRWAGSAHLSTTENDYCRLQGCDHGVTPLRITDSAGGPHCPAALQRKSVREGHAFILLYSVTKRETLEELKPFYELIRKIKGHDLCRVPVVLVGNKSDALGREVALSDGATCASEWNCAFMEISAKMDVNVQELYHVLLTQKKMFAACFQRPPKKSPVPKGTDKLLGKCIVM